MMILIRLIYFFFSSRRRHTRWPRDWSSDVCSSDLEVEGLDVLQSDRGQLVEGAVHIGGELRGQRIQLDGREGQCHGRPAFVHRRLRAVHIPGMRGRQPNSKPTGWRFCCGGRFPAGYIGSMSTAEEPADEPAPDPSAGPAPAPADAPAPDSSTAAAPRIGRAGSYSKGIARRQEILDRAIEVRSEEHTSELQSRGHLVCRLLL